jgi:phosphate transport system substrate-binding protein
VNPKLPAVDIEVLGPPPTSGTRDAFVELAMDGGCKAFPSITALAADARNAACRTMREDGGYVEAGENDNLIVQKLEANPRAMGIFGYSFLEQNADKVQGSRVNGRPGLIRSPNAIRSRGPLFLCEEAHVDVIPGIREYLKEFTSDAARGDFGYLSDKGLVPLPNKSASRSLRRCRR